MKHSAGIALLFLFHFSVAQKPPVNYGPIDRYVEDLDAASPNELARKLTAPFKTDLEKTRAIFSWIAHHISYEYTSARSLAKNNKVPAAAGSAHESDTSTVLTPLNELVSQDVLKKRSAFCYGYSRLFKFLCDEAGIPCEIINGYARGDLNRIGTNFRTNHSWNAVRLDSNWYLVDVTWASGYFTYNDDQFIKRFDEQYFLTPPEQFSLDHFPDDLKWTLLQQPPTISEFQRSPYKARCFIKYNITSYSPRAGVIHAFIGDTVNLVVQTTLEKDRNISGGSVDDSSALPTSPLVVYCKPSETVANAINYTYIVHSPAQWLHLVYNDDVILTYRLDIRNANKQD